MFKAIQKSLRVQLLILSIVVEAIMLALLLGNSLRIINDTMQEQTTLRIQAAEPLLNAATAVPLIERNYDTLINMLQELHTNQKNNFDYIVIFDEHKDMYAQVGVKGEFPLDGSYISEAENIVHRSSEIKLSGETLGYIYYGLSTASFAESKKQLLQQGVIIALIELLLSFILLLVTGYFLTKNIDKMMEQVVQNEKMSSLGSLVAGVAHEVNTPVGTSLTAATYIQHETKHLTEKVEKDDLKKSELIDYLEAMQKISKTMQFSLENAATLVRSFKQIAVDQNVEEKRSFDLKSYLDDVILSLKGELNHKDIMISNEVASNILLHSYAGIFAQVFSNLILNSTIHAFDDKGTITIEGFIQGSQLKITYKDDGCGMDQATVAKMFDPFFTTKMGQGGSGLGLSIVYNLITHKLHGSITCKSEPQKGVKIDIQIPLSAVMMS